MRMTVAKNGERGAERAQLFPPHGRIFRSMTATLGVQS
jgi:hypothetical protein